MLLTKTLLGVKLKSLTGQFLSILFSFFEKCVSSQAQQCVAAIADASKLGSAHQVEFKRFFPRIFKP